MSEATTDMNSTPPMPTRQSFGLQMEGLAMTVLYAVCFGWMHLGSGAAVVSIEVLGVFFVGLILIPLFAALPVVFVRRLMTGTIGKTSTISAFLPFASLALYGVQVLAVWVATREAYAWVFSAPVAV